MKEETLTPYKIYSGKNTSKDFSHKGKPVYQYDLDGRFIKKFNTIKEATNEISKIVQKAQNSASDIFGLINIDEDKVMSGSWNRTLTLWSY